MDELRQHRMSANSTDAGCTPLTVAQLLDSLDEESIRNRCALFDGSLHTHVTYRELRSLVYRAMRLLCKHSRPNVCSSEAPVVIGVAVSEGMWSVISFLAVTVSGAVYVPVDLEQPVERVVHALQDTGAQLLVVSDQQVSMCDEITSRCNLALCPISRCESEDGDVIVSPAEVTPSSPCYIYFTSGSTGWPKGVLVEHRSILMYAFENAACYSLGPSSRVLVASAFTFDPFVGDIISTLAARGQLCMFPRARILTELADCITECEATHICSTPAVWGHISADAPRLASLKTLCIGGEAMSTAFISQWSSHPSLKLYNTYGVTEATVYQFVHPCTPGGSPKCIGRPLRSVIARVLDENMRVADTGTEGYLYLGGPQLCREYWKYVLLINCTCSFVAGTTRKMSIALSPYRLLKAALLRGFIARETSPCTTLMEPLS